MTQYESVPISEQCAQKKFGIKDTDAKSTKCTNDCWRLLHVSFGIVIMCLGLSLLIISIHIQSEDGVGRMNRINAGVLSACAVFYVLSTCVFIQNRNLPYIKINAIIWICIVLIIQVLVIGVAKGQISQKLCYNIVIWSLTASIIFIELILMIIQHVWGHPKPGTCNYSPKSTTV